MRAIRLFTFSTACSTPFPPYRFSPSRSSTASYVPVDAPDGTEALPTTSSPARTSTSTVGFPLESSISLANISLIGICFSNLFSSF